MIVSMINKKLPTQEKIYSKLTDKKCKDEDYKTAEKVWKKFNCKSMLDYHVRKASTHEKFSKNGSVEKH